MIVVGEARVTVTASRAHHGTTQPLSLFAAPAMAEAVPLLREGNSCNSIVRLGERETNHFGGSPMSGQFSSGGHLRR